MQPVAELTARYGLQESGGRHLNAPVGKVSSGRAAPLIHQHGGRNAISRPTPGDEDGVAVPHEASSPADRLKLG